MKKIAIIADWMTTMGGAEKVLQVWSDFFPSAEFFTTVHIEDAIEFSKKHIVHASYLNILPKKIKKRHQILFPFLPMAIESLDLRGFDVVISSASFVAKGVITDESAIHICYCHTPTRYFWDEWQYFLKEGLNIPSWLSFFKFLFPPLFTRFRQWDFIASQRPDVYIGNSEYVIDRIRKYYKRDAMLLRPPVEYKKFSQGILAQKGDFYIACGRIIPYKKFDLLVRSFQKMPEKKLKIAGKGPDFEKIKNLAKGFSNIEILGFVPEDELIALLGSAQAFLFPQNEDAGIAPMEALCTGTPCIALQKGGSIGIINEQNGVFFKEQTEKSLMQAIDEFEKKQSYFLSNRNNISCAMKQYSEENFINNFLNILENSQKTKKLIEKTNDI